jgi:hypothetical protein
MSKKRNSPSSLLLGDPTVDHASELVQEYTRKIRAISQQIRDVREKYLAANQRRIKLSSAIPGHPREDSPYEQQLWIEVVNDFRSRHDDRARYLRALLPHARKLAQHVSQLITHGTNHTIVQIELSLRVAELESAIETAQKLASSNLGFQVP